MFGLILGAVGLLGGGGIAALIAKFGLKVVLGTARSSVAKVPPKAWLYIAIAAALVGGFVWHQVHAHKALKKADAAGYVRAMRDVEQRALKLKSKVDAMTAKIANHERILNDQAHRRVDRNADALLLRGPGKALCSIRSEPSAAAGSAPASGQVDGGLGKLPDARGTDLIALPFTGTVKFARQGDHCEADLTSWWSWYDKLTAAWPKAGDKSP
jgi:hypothetical protein